MAATMKVMDLSIAEPGCQMGLFSRDGAPLRHIPRNTEHVSLVAANRCALCSAFMLAPHSQLQAMHALQQGLPHLAIGCLSSQG